MGVWSVGVWSVRGVVSRRCGQWEGGVSERCGQGEGGVVGCGQWEGGIVGCGQWEGGVSGGVVTGEAWEVGKCVVCVVLVCS